MQIPPDLRKDSSVSISMMPIQLFDSDSCSYTYVLADLVTREAVLIDPVDSQLERDLSVLRSHGLQLRWSIETHTHADHITSAGWLGEYTGACTAAPAGCGIGTASLQLQDGDTLRFGGETLTAIHTPGHTAGSMCFVWRNHVFTGDTLLINGCGRTDFQSGSAADLYQSITHRLFSLPDLALVWPGHEYQGRSHSTIGTEKISNPRLAGKSKSEFIHLMGALNLPYPRRIDEAVPTNLQSGLIRHDADGVSSQLVREAVGYAGDVTPELAWQWVQNGEAVLIDVRSDAEREWVGRVPGAAVVAWKQWPAMTLNINFDQEILSATPVGMKALFMCRSGVRSIAAARRATELGLTAYNILEGFEGDPDQHAHRGKTGGWRFRGLPWQQG